MILEIIFENVVERENSHKHEYEDLVSDKEELRLTYPSPLRLQEVDQIKKKEEDEDCSHKTYFIEGSLNMSERNIHDTLITLNETKSLVSN